MKTFTYMNICTQYSHSILTDNMHTRNNMDFDIEVYFYIIVWFQCNSIKVRVLYCNPKCCNFKFAPWTRVTEIFHLQELFLTLLEHLVFIRIEVCAHTHTRTHPHRVEKLSLPFTHNFNWDNVESPGLGCWFVFSSQGEMYCWHDEGVVLSAQG